MRVWAAILAGGRATRMGGRPKSALVVAGQTILARQRAVLGPATVGLCLVSNAAAAMVGDEETVVFDRRGAGHGPLGGIETTLSAVPAGAEAVLCVACDLPFLQPLLISFLCTAHPEAEALVPVVAGRPQPLLARYRPTCLAAVAARLDAGERRATAFLRDVHTVFVHEHDLRLRDPRLLSFTNLNSPEDLAAARDHLAFPRDRPDE